MTQMAAISSTPPPSPPSVARPAPARNTGRLLAALGSHLSGGGLAMSGVTTTKASAAQTAADARTVVTFGEIMCRLAPPGNLRIRQTRDFEATYAGAEASVAGSIVNFGGVARYVTALPSNALAEAAMDTLRSVGIDCQCIFRADEGRLGLYFLETGANQRPSTVVYDRADSAISITPAEAYDWDGIFTNAQWLHLSGITPAISEVAANATLVAAKKAKAAGCQVSIDLNFRGNLWKWGLASTIGSGGAKDERELCRKVMGDILPFVDLVVGNEEDCFDVLGVKAGDTDVHSVRAPSALVPPLVGRACAHGALLSFFLPASKPDM